jgi:putative addiction module component (TIGR02574 family)
MSFNEVLAELPEMTVSERHALVRYALDLDESALSLKDLAVVERRLEHHRRNRDSAVPMEEMKERLRSRHSK